jgi:hypothetical protein
MGIYEGIYREIYKGNFKEFMMGFLREYIWVCIFRLKLSYSDMDIRSAICNKTSKMRNTTFMLKTSGNKNWKTRFTTKTNSLITITKILEIKKTL